jgi:hypothetical protein
MKQQYGKLENIIYHDRIQDNQFSLSGAQAMKEVQIEI